MVAEAQTCAIGIITILNILVALHLSGVLYKSTLFMQNKPNLPNAQMNVSEDYTEDYENKCLRRRRKNKAKTKPNKANSKPNQTQFQKGLPALLWRYTTYEIRATNYCVWVTLLELTFLVFPSYAVEKLHPTPCFRPKTRRHSCLISRFSQATAEAQSTSWTKDEGTVELSTWERLFNSLQGL